MMRLVIVRSIAAFANVPESAIGILPQNNQTCPTVVIETDNGPVEINESDFNKDEHTIFKGDKKHNPDGTLKNPPKPAAAPAATAISPPTEAAPAAAVPGAPMELSEHITKANLGVIEDDGKFYIVMRDAENAMIRRIAEGEFPDVNPKGYKTNAKAWDALLKLQALAQPGEGKA